MSEPPPSQTTGNFTIGALGVVRQFNGSIDALRIYSRALSIEEITAHYERRQYASSEPTSAIGIEEDSNITPNIPVLVSPPSASQISDTTPTLSANYSDPDTGDTGTTNYRISSLSLADCVIDTPTSLIDSGTSTPETTTNNEATEWTSSALTTDQTYYWCAQNNDGEATSAWTEMGTFILDSTSPTLTEITPISPSTDTTPDYTFNTDEAGTISYAGSCSSSTTAATLGDNTITLNELEAGTYSNCTITVTDTLSNISNALSITSFTINSMGGGFIPPTPPTIPISDSNQPTFEITTINNQTTINLSKIENVYQIAISTTPDFKYVSWEPYQESIILPDVEKVYLKFRSPTGGVSEVYEIETNTDTNTSDTNIANLPNGSLIKAINDFKVYIINNNYIRHILDSKIFNFYNHLNWESIQEVNSLNNYQESFLIRASNDYKVYEIKDKKKHWLDITAEEFENSGHSWDEVYVVNEEELGWYGEE